MNKEEEFAAELISGYRKLVDQRYQYDELKQLHHIPSSITKKKVEELKTYFLEYIYPEYSTRQVLNEAFDSLDGHIKHPEHLLRLLIDSSAIIFRYGRSLPKILRAGIKALQSFRKATKFEKILIKTAKNNQIRIPFDEAKIKMLVATLSDKEIEDFIKDGQDLFQVILDRPLVEKILKIMDTLIAKMLKRPNVYAQAEVEGLRMGYKIIEGGYSLLEGIPTSEQTQLLDLIVNIERDAFNKIKQEVKPANT